MSTLRSPRLRAGVTALAVTVVIVGALGAWQISAARDSQRTQVVDGELTAARLASSAIESGMESRLELVSNLATLSGIAKTITDSRPNVLQKDASQVLDLYPEFSSLAIDSSDGKLLAVSPAGLAPLGADVTSKPAFSGAISHRAPYISQAFSLSGVGLVVGLAAPFYSGNTIAGVIVCTVAVHNFGSIIGSALLQGGGSIVVVDQKGNALTGPLTGKGDVYGTSSMVSGALHRREGTGQATLPGFSGSRLVAYSPVQSLGWAVLVQEPISSLDNPIGTLTLHLALIDALVLLIAVVTAVLLARLLGQLAKERDEASAVLASVGEGVAIVDQSGKVIRMNPALERLSGHTSVSAKDLPWTEAFPFTDERHRELEWSESVVARAMSEHRVVASHGFSLTMLSASGSNIPVAVTAAPLMTEEGQVNGAVAVIRDMSREHEVDELKSSLVSTVSHELRTPLTMIRGFSELLLSRDDLDATRSKKALEHISESSQRLGRLIDDLLSVSRIESGGLGTTLRSVELRAVVDEVLVSFISNGAERVRLQVPDDLPAVLADPDQLYQVLSNLVSNALKYSASEAAVLVSASLGSEKIHVSVTDRGIGMTPTEIAQVFGKFARVDRPEVREVGGTGLGLYITKRLVEMMGGTIWVRSKAKEGSVFTFSVRIAPGDAEGVEPKEQVYAQAADR